MGGYFKPWWRKMGVLTLVMACMFAAGWVRSIYVADQKLLVETNTLHFWLVSRGATISLQFVCVENPLSIQSPQPDSVKVSFPLEAGVGQCTIPNAQLIVYRDQTPAQRFELLGLSFSEFGTKDHERLLRVLLLKGHIGRSSSH